MYRFYDKAVIQLKWNMGGDSVQENRVKDIELKMKQDSEDRNRILEEVARNMDAHTKKIVEYDHKAKTLDLLEVKYNNLLRESETTITQLQEKNNKLIEENKNLENEVMILKRTIVNYKSKVNNLQSVVELLINDFGIEQVSLATGLEKDKLKEYLKD